MTGALPTPGETRLGVDHPETAYDAPPPPEPFTHPDLATDPVRSRQALACLDALLQQVVDLIGEELEPIERALRLTELESSHAAELRTAIRATLGALENAVSTLDQGRLALRPATPTTMP